MKKLPVIAAILAAALVTIWSNPVFSHETLTTTVLFDREIVQILNRRCVMCHFEKGPSFPLETYEQTWLRGRQIRASVIARHMPPWNAVSGYGQFENDNSLTLRESQFVVSWVEGLGPRNSGTVFTNIVDDGAPRRKAIRAETNFEQPQLGKPGMTVALPSNTVEARSADSVVRTTVDLGLTVERRVRAIEYLPGDRRVTRAVFFTIQETGQWIGSWTPWYGFTSLPNGDAYRLPPGAHITTDIYYRGASERVVDQGVLRLFFEDSAKSASVTDMTLSAKPAGLNGPASRKFRAEIRIAADMDVLALRPEILPGVDSIEVSSRRPDGGTDILLYAKDLAIDWPAPFLFKDPVVLHKGATLIMTTYMNPKALLPSSYQLTVSRAAH
jgi:hypothetical protein